MQIYFYRKVIRTKKVSSTTICQIFSNILPQASIFIMRMVYNRSECTQFHCGHDGHWASKNSIWRIVSSFKYIENEMIIQVVWDYILSIGSMMTKCLNLKVHKIKLSWSVQALKENVEFYTLLEGKLSKIDPRASPSHPWI